MNKLFGWLMIVALVATAGTADGQLLKHFNKKKHQYADVNFEDLMHRYFEKEVGPLTALEGIYSVSCVITRRSRPLLSNFEKTKVISRKDNYARVAILKDRPGSQRDYIEVSLSYHEANRYPIMGELTTVGDSRGLIYKHIEPDGSTLNFSMINDTDLIEGEYSFMIGKRTITYHISYLRIFPKGSDTLTLNNTALAQPQE
jgi:hypothetical protein